MDTDVSLSLRLRAMIMSLHGVILSLKSESVSHDDVSVERAIMYGEECYALLGRVLFVLDGDVGISVVGDPCDASLGDDISIREVVRLISILQDFITGRVYADLLDRYPVGAGDDGTWHLIMRSLVDLMSMKMWLMSYRDMLLLAESSEQKYERLVAGL